jgi:hypothetical protein
LIVVALILDQSVAGAGCRRLVVFVSGLNLAGKSWSSVAVYSGINRFVSFDALHFHLLDNLMAGEEK